MFLQNLVNHIYNQNIPAKFPYFALKHYNLENNHPYSNGH
jgi:hypothetical protein